MGKNQISQNQFKVCYNSAYTEHVLLTVLFSLLSRIRHIARHRKKSSNEKKVCHVCKLQFDIQPT